MKKKRVLIVALLALIGCIVWTINAIDAKSANLPVLERICVAIAIITGLASILCFTIYFSKPTIHHDNNSN